MPGLAEVGASTDLPGEYITLPRLKFCEYGKDN